MTTFAKAEATWEARLEADTDAHMEGGSSPDDDTYEDYRRRTLPLLEERGL